MPPNGGQACALQLRRRYSERWQFLPGQIESVRERVGLEKKIRSRRSAPRASETSGLGSHGASGPTSFAPCVPSSDASLHPERPSIVPQIPMGPSGLLHSSWRVRASFPWQRAEHISVFYGRALVSVVRVCIRRELITGGEDPRSERLHGRHLLGSEGQKQCPRHVSSWPAAHRPSPPLRPAIGLEVGRQRAQRS